MALIEHHTVTLSCDQCGTDQIDVDGQQIHYPDAQAARGDDRQLWSDSYGRLWSHVDGQDLCDRCNGTTPKQKPLRSRRLVRFTDADGGNEELVEIGGPNDPWSSITFMERRPHA